MESLLLKFKILHILILIFILSIGIIFTQYRVWKLQKSYNEHVIHEFNFHIAFKTEQVRMDSVHIIFDKKLEDVLFRGRIKVIEL